MKKVKTPFVIISAERFTLTKGENQKRHQELLTQLKKDGFKTKVVEGVYHGQTEKSILVLLDSKFLAVDLGYMKNYGMIFDQESILFVDADRKAELHFPVSVIIFLNTLLFFFIALIMFFDVPLDEIKNNMSP